MLYLTRLQRRFPSVLSLAVGATPRLALRAVSVASLTTILRCAVVCVFYFADSHRLVRAVFINLNINFSYCF